MRYFSYLGVFLMAALGVADATQAQPRYRDAPGRDGPRLLEFSRQGDWELGIDWDGTNGFSNGTVRYFLADRLAPQVSLEYDRSTFDSGTGSDEADLIRIQTGLLYEFCETRKSRAYLLPTAGFERRTLSSQSQDVFVGGLLVGGDTRITRNFALGLTGGLTYSSTSQEGGGDGSKLWAGILSQLRATLRIPAHREVMPE